jgi:hypothetical protein
MTPSSGAERAKKEGMPISQVLYLAADGALPHLPLAFISGPELAEAVE